jgi:flagellin-like protein
MSRRKRVMPAWSRTRRRRDRRAVSPIIAVIFLLGMTIVAGTLLWSFRVPLPASSVTIWYETLGSATMQPYEDGSDCKTAGMGANATETCDTLPAIDIVVTSSQPAGLSLSSLQLYFMCEGTVYLSGSLASMEIVPGSTGTIGGGPGTGVPQLGTCGSYVPPSAAFNRFMYFQQLTPGDNYLEPGDQFIISAQGFSPPYCAFAPSTLDTCWITAAENTVVQANSKLFPSWCPVPQYDKNSNPATNGSYGLIGCDDDYHGVPTPDCYVTVGACELDVAYLGQPPALALRLSMVGLFAPSPT